MKKVYPFLIPLFLFTSNACFKPLMGPLRDEAYLPVYGYDTTLRKITAAPPQPTVTAGKIYVLGKRLYQVEQGKGIHVIDYTDEQRPKKLGFISIAGCSEVSVKNDVLFTNSMNDVVSVDISDLERPKELSRVIAAFNTLEYYNENAMSQKPPYANVYYRCPGGYEGDVVGWKLVKKVRNVNCYTN